MCIEAEPIKLDFIWKFCVMSLVDSTLTPTVG